MLFDSMNTKKQKFLLNTIVVAAFGLICLLFLTGLGFVWFKEYSEAGVRLMSVRIAISIILIWFMIFIPYLAWAVYFYNINLGKTNEEWEVINIKNATAKTESEKISPDNPYREETFGLPKGTIRGSLAITLMVGGLSLFVVAIGHPTILKDNEFFHENFDFFKTAFLMMIAFYFGSKGLEILQKRSASEAELKRKEEGETDASAELPKDQSGVGGGGGGGGFPEITNTKKKLQDSFDDDVDDTPQPVGENPATAPVSSDVPIIPKNDEPEKQETLTDEDIRKAAERLKVEIAAIHAVIAVESKGKGFFSDGRPIILFEGHVFWKQLENKKVIRAKLAAEHPEIVYKTWTREFYKRGSREYERFKIASSVDEQAAKKSTSWGLFQIMGFNHEACGFKTVDEFVTKMSLNEGEQLSAFMNFCEHHKLNDFLRKKDWAGFAQRYNGPEYKKNQYDYKLEMIYNEYSRYHNSTLEARLVRQTQNDKQTEGTLTVYDSTDKSEVFTCKTLELSRSARRKNVAIIFICSMCRADPPFLFIPEIIILIPLDVYWLVRI
jgi:hypothetical protein